MTADSDIICERIGAAGVVTLNRPRALNALNLAMVRAMTPALREWAGDPAVTRVVVRGAGDRAFCAGGDIRALYDQGLAGDRESALAFWREEYRLNAMIARYPKPYVSLIDGICMGGGVGLSLHGSHRVAGDRYLFAMPEVGIGFFPDVGATYALPRLPGHAGLWLALTGDRVKAADAVALGLATSRVSSSALPALTDDLIAGRDVQAAIAARAAPAEEGPLAAERSVIDRCFGGASVEETLSRSGGVAVCCCGRRHDPGQIADESQDRLRADAPRRGAGFRGGDRAGVSHRDAHHRGPGLLRRRARGDHRQGQCAALDAGDAGRREPCRCRGLFRAARTERVARGVRK